MPLVSIARGTPLAIPGIGVLRLDPSFLVPLPPVTVPAASGPVSSLFTVPRWSALIGGRFFTQTVFLDASGRARLAGFTTEDIVP